MHGRGSGGWAPWQVRVQGRHASTIRDPECRWNWDLFQSCQVTAVFDETGFADLHPVLDPPAYAPWRRALVTLMQFREGLSDCQAAEAGSTGNTCLP